MVSKTLTIGEIIRSLEIEIFTSDSQSNKKYIQRELGIKQAINICMEQIVELAKAPGLSKSSNRQKVKSEKCIENLSRYIRDLIGELDKDKIEGYVKKLEHNKRLPSIILNRPFELDISFLISNSFHTAITTEILWAPRVTVKQAMDISRGKLDLNDLGRHLPALIEEVRNEILLYLKQSSNYSEFYQSIKESLDCFRKKYYRACNLLIITTIEGMVRKLANFLAKPHDLGDEFSDSNYHSLNTLLRDVKWKKDYQIDPTTLSLLIGQDKTMDQRRKENSYDLGESIFIDLNTRLDFLKGRFKDDRDLILHGSYLEYNKEWNLFLNFSALSETKKVCEYYEKKYKN